jgi:hypothetical protein
MGVRRAIVRAADPRDQVSRRSRILAAIAHGPAPVYGPGGTGSAWTGMPMTLSLPGRPAAPSADSDHKSRSAGKGRDGPVQRR